MKKLILSLVLATAAIGLQAGQNTTTAAQTKEDGCCAKAKATACTQATQASSCSEAKVTASMKAACCKGPRVVMSPKAAEQSRKS